MDYIDKEFWKLTNGQAGKYYQPVAKYLTGLESIAIASIILKVTFDQVFSTREREDYVLSVITKIGQALEA